MDGFKYELWQGGIVVAEVEAFIEADALREIQHYTLMYANDGPCFIKRAAELEELPSKVTPIAVVGSVE